VFDPTLGLDPLGQGGTTPYPAIYKGVPGAGGAWASFGTKHASTHASGGNDELHGSQIEVGATPTGGGYGSWAIDSLVSDILDGLNLSLATVNTALSGKASTSHASTHASGGSDELHADQIEMGAGPSVAGFGSWASDSTVYDVINGFNQSLDTAGDQSKIGTGPAAGGKAPWSTTSTIYDAIDAVNRAVQTETVSNPATSVTPATTDSNILYTNEGCGSEFIATLHASDPIGYKVTVVDVGGTGGISVIAPAGESIRVGLSVTSGAARKVKCTDGAGAGVTLVKMASSLWVAMPGAYEGTWVGS
jgi:hypothetical protein